LNSSNDIDAILKYVVLTKVSSTFT